MSQPRTLPRAALGVLLLAAGTSSLAASIDPVDRYAWGENIGWVNHRDASGAVQVYADHLEGFAWAENLGWVKLGSHSGGGTHSYGNGSASDWGVNNSSGTLSGYAWSENAGWVSFAPTGGGVTIANGIFDGYAWGASCKTLRPPPPTNGNASHRRTVEPEHARAGSGMCVLQATGTSITGFCAK